MSDITADRLGQRLRAEQDLNRAIIGAAVSGAVGASLWASIGMATGYEVRFMAIAVGMIVGYSVRLAGKGITAPFGMIAVLATIGACMLGNLLTVAIIISGEQGIGLVEVLVRLDFSLAVELMFAFSQPVDSLFYAIATIQAWHLAFRKLSRIELALLSTEE